MYIYRGGIYTNKNIFNKMMQKEGKYTKYLFHKIGRK